jgi:hypothetical protein
MSQANERKKLWLAILASLCLHVVIALSLAAFSGSTTPLPPEEDKPAELTMIDLSATPPPVKANPAYMETDPSKEAPEPPKEKTFESNANSIAASKEPATGDLPLPSQNAPERPFIDLQTQDSSLPVDGSRAVAQQPTPPPSAQATPQPTAAPSAKPEPSATPVPTPVATPAPASTPEPDKLAMLTSTPPPPLRDGTEVEETPPPQVGPTTPPVDVTRPQPQTPASTYRPEKQETRIKGRLTGKGPSAVNAVGTPLGKYQKQVTDAIGARWYYYMKEKMDLVNIGTARLEAEVDERGKIRNLKVLSNDANEAFANICLQSFQEAQIPPIPPELIATLPAGRLPVEISFTTYANR